MIIKINIYYNIEYYLYDTWYLWYFKENNTYNGNNKYNNCYFTFINPYLHSGLVNPEEYLVSIHEKHRGPGTEAFPSLGLCMWKTLLFFISLPVKSCRWACFWCLCFYFPWNHVGGHVLSISYPFSLVASHPR